MNKISVLVLLFLLSFAKLFASESALTDSLKQAEVYYTNQEYASAVRLYEYILDQGSESAPLYFNLANAYFKNGNVAKSILNYERALLRDPHDPAILENLIIARSYQVDKIEVIPEFALSVWISSVASLMHSDTWAVLSVLFFVLFLSSLTMYLFSSSLGLKKAGFFAAIAVFILFLATTGMARFQKNRIELNPYAIILTPSVTVKSAPDNSGTDLLVIHEGMKVETADVVGDWIEIKLTDGSVGWVLKNDLEMI